jgi:hypothetical protein
MSNTNYKVTTDEVDYLSDDEEEDELKKEFARLKLKLKLLNDKKKRKKKMSKSKLLKNFIKSGEPHAGVSWNNMFKTSQPVRYYLNVECTQFTIGKTGKTLDRVGISNAAKLHQAYSFVNEEKVISIIISSCNLAETAQWKVRTNGKFGKSLNICTISSKTRTTNKGSGNKIGDFIAGLVNTDNKNLPDILLMCAHSKRVKDDLLILLRSQKRIISTSGKQFKFNLFFDEADKNIGLITDSLKKIRSDVDIDTGKNMDSYLNEVHFITATPTTPFWNALRKISIKELSNFDIEFGNEISDEQRKKARDKYQSILTQPFIDFQGPGDSLENIKMIMNSNHVPSIGCNTQNIIFAPAENKVITHNAVKDYFLEKGYHVFIHNGRHKGVYDPSRRFMSIEELNLQYNLDTEKSEVRDTLRMWKIKNPSASLAVTGWYTITRGLTFNTDGFNFTHMIFGWCHAKKLAEFVQLLGRCCGHSDYCKPIKIIGPIGAFKNAQLFVSELLDLKESNVTEYSEKDFKKNKANEGIIFEEYLTWQEARSRIKKIHPRCNPFNIGRKNELLPQPDNDGFYMHTIRNNRAIMTIDYIINNRSWGINKNNKYRIHVGYGDIKNKETCKWIVCYRKEDSKEVNPKEDKCSPKTKSVLDAFNIRNV